MTDIDKAEMKQLINEMLQVIADKGGSLKELIFREKFRTEILLQLICKEHGIDLVAFKELCNCADNLLDQNYESWRRLLKDTNDAEDQINAIFRDKHRV